MDIDNPSSDAPRLLLEAVASLQADTRERWNRSLGAADLATDRWERAVELGFGDGASIYGSAIVFGDVHVGSNTWIGPNVLLDGSGGLTIGDNCSISAGVQIYTHDTVRWALSNGVAPYERQATKIGSQCHIGAQATISRGVTVGHMSVVGAHSFVNRDVPDRSVAVGSPARVIGRVVGDGEAVRIEITDQSGR